MPALPDDYLERTYAGVLGKLIGVYLGRPFEGWSHARILAELGEVDRYVHERFGAPLVVTDDDISGTFTFPRALEDRGHDPALTPAQIGESWLNYLVENRTILWWGGMGTSTEHTAYLRLKSGIPAPESGSIARNGVTIAQQIGAQIFIDGWAMTCPGEPDRAIDLARRAASVSHDGEAMYGAQVVAAIEAEAYVNPALDHLLDTALEWVIPDPGGPIAAIGAVVTGAAGATVFLDRLGWSGAPAVTLGPSPFPGERWRRAWIDGVDEWNPRWPDPFHLSQNAGTGLIAQGTEEWADYRVEVDMRMPLAAEAGLAVRVGGMRRWYGLLLGADGIARLVREGDGRAVLAEAPYALDPARTYALSLEVTGSRLRGSVDGAVVLEGADAVLHGGGVGLVVREGTVEAGPVRVTPASVRRGCPPCEPGRS